MSTGFLKRRRDDSDAAGRAGRSAAGIAPRAWWLHLQVRSGPTRDLLTGKLYALKIVVPRSTTGEAIWVPLDRDAVQVDADAEATRAGATGYGRPEDVELATSTGSAAGGSNILYVAVTDENRVLRIDLREPAGGSDHHTAFVSDYVARGVNAPAISTTRTTWHWTSAATSTLPKTPARLPGWISGWPFAVPVTTRRPRRPFDLPASLTALPSRAASTSTKAAVCCSSTCSTAVARILGTSES